jgi:hypothetical protein
MSRQLSIYCYRHRIKEDADIKLYQSELESLILCFIDRLAQIQPEDNKEIDALYAAEISLLSEGFSPELIHRKFLPIYREIVSTAVNDGYLDPRKSVSKDIATSILLESCVVQRKILSIIAFRNYEITILQKVGQIFFTLWDGVEYITIEQLAKFYNVPFTRVQAILRSHSNEFSSDGVKTLINKELTGAILKFKITSGISSLAILNPRSAIRLGFLLRNSDVAKALRTVSLDFIEKAPRRSSVELLLAYQEIVGEKKELDVVEQQDVASIGEEEKAPLVSTLNALGQPQETSSIDTPSQLSALSLVKNNSPRDRIDDWGQATDAAHQDAWRTILLAHCS